MYDTAIATGEEATSTPANEISVDDEPFRGIVFGLLLSIPAWAIVYGIIKLIQNLL